MRRTVALTMLIAAVGDAGVDRYHGVAGTTLVPGGCAFNVAVNLKRCLASHHRTVLVSTIGSDEAGQFMSSALSLEGLDEHVDIADGKTPVQDIEILRDGEKNFFAYEPGVIVSRDLSVAQAAVAKSADFVVSVLYSQNEAWLRRLVALPRRGRLVLDFMTMRDFSYSLRRVEHFLTAADIAVFGLEAEDSELVREIRSHALSARRTIIITLGAKGSVAFEHGVEFKTLAVPVAKVVDTTGAGDAFIAGLVASLAEGATFRDAVKSGHARAASVVTKLGAT